MTNRNDEFKALAAELSQPPEYLQGSVFRARDRDRRRRRVNRWLGAPTASLAAVAACFVLLVNVFPTFALACSNVPVIRELAAAVAFSPSLSAALEHDYVQYIGQSKTVDGVTVNLEYAIVDKHQAVFFYSVDGGRFWTSPDITAADWTPVGGYAISGSYLDDLAEEKLKSVTLSFSAENSLPDRFTMEMYFIPEPEREQADAVMTAAPEASPVWDVPESHDPREDPSVLRFAFDITLDPARISEGRTVEVGEWLELDGQRVLVDRLELFPTRTILYLGEDGDNTAWLRSLKFRFEDEKGKCFDNTDGSLTASGEAGSRSFLTYYFQSFYYDQPEGLTLCIDKAEWLDKDAHRAFIDLTTGESTGLPKGTEVDDITRSGKKVVIKLLIPMNRMDLAQTVREHYWDPDGGEHSWNSSGKGIEYNDRNEEIGIYEMLFLDDYPWDTVELELSYTSVSEYAEPVRVPLIK